MSKTKTPRKAKVNKRAGSYKPGSMSYIWYKIRTTPTAMVATCFIIGLFIFSFVSPFVLSNDYLEINMMNQNATPSWAHIFGCDEIGRDIFARIIYGARYTMSIGIFTTAISCIVGGLLGAIAGYFGGHTDNIIMRVLDVFQSFPGILLSITISTVLGPGFSKIILALGIGMIPGYARMMRASIMRIRDSEYIEAVLSIYWKSFVLF